MSMDIVLVLVFVPSATLDRDGDADVDEDGGRASASVAMTSPTAWKAFEKLGSSLSSNSVFPPRLCRFTIAEAKAASVRRYKYDWT
jgi:hypothetical protein